MLMHVSIPRRCSFSCLTRSGVSHLKPDAPSPAASPLPPSPSAQMRVDKGTQPIRKRAALALGELTCSYQYHGSTLRASGGHSPRLELVWIPHETAGMWASTRFHTTSRARQLHQHPPETAAKKMKLPHRKAAQATDASKQQQPDMRP